MKTIWVIWPVMSMLFSACSSNVSYSKASYSETLEIMLKETVDDTDNKEIMGYYKELGGARASEERGHKACKALEDGADIETLAMTNHLDEYYEELGMTQPWGNSDFEKVKVLVKLLNAEIFTAQLAFCPETKIEIEL